MRRTDSLQSSHHRFASALWALVVFLPAILVNAQTNTPGAAEPPSIEQQQIELLDNNEPPSPAEQTELQLAKDDNRQKTLAEVIRGKMPAWLKQDMLTLQVWQLLGIVLIIIIGFIVERLATFLLNGLARKWLSMIKIKVDEKQQQHMMRALGVAVMAAVWWLGLKTLGLPENINDFLMVAIKIIVCVAVVWAAYRLVDVTCSYLSIRAAATDTKFDDVLVPLLRKSLKCIVVVFGLVFIANNLKIEIMSLLTALGIGGMAMAFAAKDTIANFFGSITVLTDRPFSVGDWVIVDGHEGTVEELGFRSTRIRTFYNSVITVPNANLATTAVDNMGARRYRRFKAMLAVTYDTPPDKIEKLCEGIRQIVRSQEGMRKDYFHVYLNKFEASSLDILLYVFFDVPDWSAELAGRQEFMLSVLRLAEKTGIEWAFPTRTIHLASGQSAASLAENESPPGD